MLQSRLLTAGTALGNSLGEMAQRELGVSLDKSHQKDDWSKDLSDEQLQYAAFDAQVTAELYPILAAKIREAKLDGVADLERRATPAILWMARSGIPFDRARWEWLAHQAEQETEDLARQLDERAPVRNGFLSKAGAWNWSSPQQVAEVFRLLGIETTCTDDASLAAIDHPIADLLRRHRAASKRVGTYGMKWLKHVSADGRVYPRWNQLGAVTGRMSCSTPNVQQLPRGDCRRCVAAPAGRAIIKADWSQLHLRIIAGEAPESAMQAAFGAGVDIHTATARHLTGKEDVSKDERQRAKVAAFGLCYGMGRDRFRAFAHADYGLDLTADEAESLRREFFRAYPGLKAWHRRQAEGAIRLTAPSGRICRNVEKFSDKLAYSILMIEADCLKTALAACWEGRGQVPGTHLVLACHDELVVEADLDKAEATESWLVNVMLDAAAPYLAPVPVEVSAVIGTTWGGGEIRKERTYRKG
jgi:DNA polymerase-1